MDLQGKGQNNRRKGHASKIRYSGALEYSNGPNGLYCNLRKGDNMKPSVPVIQSPEQHARGFELRIAVLSILDQFAPDGVTLDQYFETYYWAAYAKAYGMETRNAAMFGAVQVIM